jgi:hypothetical protein
MERKTKSQTIMVIIMISVAIVVTCCKKNPVDSDPNTDNPGVVKGSRLYPDDLVYKGAFRVPRDRGTVNGYEVWYGRGYTHESTMNWDNTNKSILMPGLSGAANYMGGFTLAQPVISASKNAKELNTAVMNAALPFTDLSNKLQHIEKNNQLVLSSAYFDGQRILWVLFNTYDVSGRTDPRLGVSSAWSADNVIQVTTLHNQPPVQWGKWIVDIDDQWAVQNLGYKAFGLGSNRTNGSFGPSIYFINKESIKTPSPSISNIQGIFYDSKHTVNSFSVGDSYADAVWINYNGKSAYVVLVRNSFRAEMNNSRFGYVGADRWWSTAGNGRSVAYKSTDLENTTLATAISATATSIPVANISVLPSKGYILIGGELIYYSAVNRGTNTLLGCTRGAIYHSSGTQTQAADHSAGSAVTQCMPDIILYGSHIDGYDPCISIPMLHFYDVDEIAEIVRGERQSWDIQPYAYMTLDKEFYRSMGALNGDVGMHIPFNSNKRIAEGSDWGITIDPDGNLYIGEKDGDPEVYSRLPIIHQYSITGQGAAPSTASPSAPSNVKVNSSGVVSWGASNSEVLYVIFKWFDEPHYSLPEGEYRPIRTSLAPTWTDRYYKSGDKYQIIAYDRNMNASSPSYSGE